MTTLAPTPTLLAHADLLLLLVDLLRAPPQVVLATEAEARQVAAAAVPADSALVDGFEQLMAAAARTPLDQWSVEYHRLFEGSVACPTNEAAFIRRDKGVLLADIAGFYRAFGVELASGTGERPDHIRCELEFLAVLVCMLIQARDSGNTEDQEVTLAAMHSFMGDHLGCWAETFCAALAAAATLEVYQRLAAVIPALLREICGSLSLPAPEPAASALPAPEENEPDLTCGLTDGPALTPCTISPPAPGSR